MRKNNWKHVNERNFDFINLFFKLKQLLEELVYEKKEGNIL